MKPLAILAMVALTGFAIWMFGGRELISGRLAQVAGLSEAQLQEEGMSWSPYEQTRYLGKFPLLSKGVSQLGKIRRVTFEDGSRFHFEALVTCARPLIEDRFVHVYQRTNNESGVVAYYVVCGMDAPHEITRSFRPG